MTSSASAAGASRDSGAAPGAAPEAASLGDSSSSTGLKSESGKKGKRPFIPHDLHNYPGFPVRGNKPEAAFFREVFAFWRNRRRQTRAKRTRSEERGSDAKRQDRRPTPQKPKASPNSGTPSYAEAAKTGESAGTLALKVTNRQFPYKVFVFGEGEGNRELREEVLAVFVRFITKAWLTLPKDHRALVKINSTSWSNGRGEVRCRDARTRNWVRTLAEHFEATDGSRVKLVMAEDLNLYNTSVKINRFMVHAIEPLELVRSILDACEISGGVYLKTSIATPDGGRVLRLLVEEPVANRIRELKGLVIGGPQDLVFVPPTKVRGQAEEEVETEEGAPGPSGEPSTEVPPPQGSDTADVNMEDLPDSRKAPVRKELSGNSQST